MTILSKQFIFFILVGIFSLGIDIGVTTAFYNYFSFSAFYASFVGFLTGFLFNFPVNRQKVFRNSNGNKFSLRAQLIIFLSLSIFNLFASSAAISMLVSAHILEIGYAKILMAGIVALWNFVILKYLIFSKSKE